MEQRASTISDKLHVNLVCEINIKYRCSQHILEGKRSKEAILRHENLHDKWKTCTVGQ